MPQTDDGMIDPGEKVGDFLITTGDKKDVNYLYELDCADEDDVNTTCNVGVGQKVNVSWGVIDPGHDIERNLNTIWSEHTYKMQIDGHPVKLEAFGPIDAYHVNEFNNSFIMRHWNVWIVSDKPGEIKIQSSGVIIGDAFEGIITLIFNE